MYAMSETRTIAGVRDPKSSVYLTTAVDKQATKAAKEAGLSKTKWIAALVVTWLQKHGRI